MSSNTKVRSEFIFNTAASVLEAAGRCTAIDELSLEERWPILDEMYKSVMSQTGCVRETAKRNIAKALRRSRYGEMQKRGGARPGPHPGRPPTSGEVVYEGWMGREVAKLNDGKFYAYMNDKNGQIHWGREFAKFTWPGIKSIGEPLDTLDEAIAQLNKSPWGDEEWKSTPAWTDEEFEAMKREEDE